MPLLHHNARGAGAVQTVLLVLGILFSLGGIAAIAEGLFVASASSSLGGMFGSLAATEEETGAVFLALGILMIGVAVATWGGKKRHRVTRSKRAISTAHSVILGFGLTVLAIGVLLIVVAGGFYSPAPMVLLVLGAILTFLGTAETFIETEGRHRK